MVTHINSAEGKWKRFIIGFLFLPYFVYMLIKLYNTHKFNGSNVEHRKFTWTPESKLYLIFFILFIVLQLFFFMIIAKLTTPLYGLNNILYLRNPIFNGILIVTIYVIWFFISIIYYFLLSYLSVKVIYSHKIVNNEVTHKMYSEEYILVWMMGLIIVPIIYLYLLYKLSECYSFHDFNQ